MAKRKLLSLYFGVESLAGVEVEAQKITGHFHIPLISEEGIAEEVSQDVKIVALLKEEFRKKRIEPKEAFVGLAAKDFLVRYFSIPFVPKEELDSAVKFEARKYLPFKLEELTIDYHTQIQKKEKKIYVIFAAMRKDVLENYLNILRELNLKVLSLGVAFFPLIKILKFFKQLTPSETQAIVEIGKEGGNIIITEKEIPRFSRDIGPLLKPQGLTEDLKDLNMSRLLNDVRISFDYYSHQSPHQKINHIIFLIEKDLKKLTEDLKKEWDIPSVILTPNDLLKREDFDLSLLNAYAVALESKLKSPFRINLYREKRISPSLAIKKEELEFRLDYRKFIWPAVAGIILVFLGYGLGIYRLNSTKKEITRLKVSLEDKKYNTLSLTNLKSLKKDIKQKNKKIKTLIESKLTFTPKLDKLVELRPKGLWFNEIEFSQRYSDIKSYTFRIKGSVYLDDEKKEINAVNKFLSNLKNNAEFSKIFKEIKLVSMTRQKQEKFFITNFEVVCE